MKLLYKVSSVRFGGEPFREHIGATNPIEAAEKYAAGKIDEVNDVVICDVENDKNTRYTVSVTSSLSFRGELR